MKIVTLPDLPEKGDVSNWLASGGTRERLEVLVANAPEWTPSTAACSEDEKQGFTFTRVSDLVSEPEEPVTWLVDGLLPAGGLSIAVAKPKVGKTTLARALGVAVAQGTPFLGRRTQAGPVLYVALEDKRSIIRERLRAFSVGEAPLFLHIGPIPGGDPFAWLQAAILTYHAILVIIDPLARLVRVKDIKDYAEITKVTEPVIALAHQTGCHIYSTHHAPKSERNGIDAALGSTQLAGFVDTLMVLRRHGEGLRTVETIQRSGDDLPETVVTLDATSGALVLDKPLADVHRARAQAAILALVDDQLLTENDIRERIGGDRNLTANALRQLVRSGGDPALRQRYKGRPLPVREREERE